MVLVDRRASQQGRKAEARRLFLRPRQRGLRESGALLKTCSSSDFGSRWEAAHLIPHCLSGPTFWRMIASMHRCFEMVSPWQRALAMVKSLLGRVVAGLSYDKGALDGQLEQSFDASAREASRSTIPSTRLFEGVVHRSLYYASTPSSSSSAGDARCYRRRSVLEHNKYPHMLALYFRRIAARRSDNLRATVVLHRRPALLASALVGGPLTSTRSRGSFSPRILPLSGRLASRSTSECSR